VDLTAVEDELRRIPEVRAARIVADEKGDPVEVHIVATTGKNPKQLVRDVQSVAIAAGGVDFDHRIVSVVQLEEDDADAVTQTSPANGNDNGDGYVDLREGANRVAMDSVLVSKADRLATATVTLRRGEESVVGTAHGTVASTARWRIVAEAALAALRLLEPEAANIFIEMAGVHRFGPERSIGVVTLLLVIPPNEEVLAGAAPVRGGGDEDAIVRAVLDATNRRLARLRRS